jgi:hypothetical protein
VTGQRGSNAGPLLRSPSVTVKRQYESYFNYECCILMLLGRHQRTLACLGDLSKLCSGSRTIARLHLLHLFLTSASTRMHGGNGGQTVSHRGGGRISAPLHIIPHPLIVRVRPSTPLYSGLLQSTPVLVQSGPRLSPSPSPLCFRFDSGPTLSRFHFPFISHCFRFSPWPSSCSCSCPPCNHLQFSDHSPVV